MEMSNVLWQLLGNLIVLKGIKWTCCMVLCDLLKISVILNCNYPITVTILHAARIIPTHLLNILTYYTNDIFPLHCPEILSDFDVLYK